MKDKQTALAVAAITDEGQFERLATAILREAEPSYRSIIHTGVNAAGKTVKSPLDGICYEQGADPPHMIAVHHTITARKDLEKKWLHDPSKVNPRKGSRSSAPAGDLVKTAELVASERAQRPNLRVTLVLTTNQEPDEAVVRKVMAAGHDLGIIVDPWSCTRLSHFLDKPAGQWIRRLFLKIEQEQLSAELLHELSRKSLEVHRRKFTDNPAVWIPRQLDSVMTNSLQRRVTFLVAGSGMGKSVACYRKLSAHVEAGGFGIVLPHEVVASAMTLEQAVMVALRQIHPPLAEVGYSARSFCSIERRMLLVVEDINHSGQPQLLLEKLASWSQAPSEKSSGEPAWWQLVCPVWPEVLLGLGDQARKRVEPLVIRTDRFTPAEGCDAVLARARQDGRELGSLTAAAISQALGHDPLLIALHESDKAPDPHQTIHQFVEGVLNRVVAAERDHPAADYRQALRVLAGEMLSNRLMEPDWHVVGSWVGRQGTSERLLNNLVRNGQLIRLIGPSDDQRILFRHDRVRDWLLADSAAEIQRQNGLPEEVVSEPYFAEVIGNVLAWSQPEQQFLQRVMATNPLALFHALRQFGQATSPRNSAILGVIDDWLSDPSTHERSNLHLRWEALAMLAQTESPAVPSLVRKFRDRTTNGQLARLRNGDLSGGIELCADMEPGLGVPWRDIHIEHAKLRYGQDLIQALDRLLRREELSGMTRIGAIRLAGHLADPSLAMGVEACWMADGERSDRLSDYLWGFGECCGENPGRFLGPICEAWAALSDQSEGGGRPSPRNKVALHGLQWAFRRWPPVNAIDYLIDRGSRDDLKWQITNLLHGVDHPKAVLFVTHELAAIQRSLEGTQRFSLFAERAKDDWARAQEDLGQPMSKASRDVLLGLWRNRKNDKHLRFQAFSLWAATVNPDDLELLRAEIPPDILADNVLRARLIRGDQLAIPALIDKLALDIDGFWWQLGRYLWSQELTEALDELFERRRQWTDWTWGIDFKSDWIVHELAVRLPEGDAERLLLKHWSHLRFSHHFVQAALYLSTPDLLAAAQAAIKECPEPAKLLVHLNHGFGIGWKGHQGLTRESQVRNLAPYLNLVEPFDLRTLWEECNNKGWFSLRQELLDYRVEPPFIRRRWDQDRAMPELDKMVVNNGTVRIKYWINDALKMGLSWGEVSSAIRGWYDQRRSLDALNILASALLHHGTRDDLRLLIIYEGMPEKESRQLIEDTQFAVRRRSIR